MIAAIIQARLSSTRLPQKVLADIGGSPMLWRVMEAAAAIDGIDAVIVAVPFEDYEPLRSRITNRSFLWHTGPREHVLARFWGAARAHKVKTIMRLTADDPLLSSTACSKVLRAFLDADVDYASNVGPDTDGNDCEVFSYNALCLALARATTPHDKEHVTPWMRAHLRTLHVPVGQIPAKWSVDTEEDLARVRREWEERWLWKLHDTTL